MKLFVSGKVGEGEGSARSAIELVRNAGYEVTFDWTQIEHLKPYDENVEKCREAALLESRGVLDADALIVLAHPAGVGMYLEMGIAIGRGKPVFVVTDGPSRSMFFYHPLVRRFRTVDEVLDYVDRNPDQLSPPNTASHEEGR